MSIRKHIKVFTVFSFLRLRSPDIRWYQWVYPTLFFLLFYVVELFVNDVSFNSLDRPKLIADINDLIGFLVGFYIAALAAITSFKNESLDKEMGGRTPKLVHVRQGRSIEEKLTRRRFLAVLFGYCAGLSIFLYIFGMVSLHFELSKLMDTDLTSTITIVWKICGVAYIWALSSLLVVTLLGLHYLIERMHRP